MVATNLMVPTRNDLAEDIRHKMVDLCNRNLATALDLYSQLKQAHWNVKGMQFIQLHELFDKVAGEVLEDVDMIAERATALGGTALGTARMAAAGSALPEYPAEAHGSKQHVELVADRLAAYGKALRDAIHTAEAARDQDTQDMFTQISREADKNLWFVEAHLQA
ncbi:MAG: DNA starvation/stationary phase protection protein Dps [Bryobacterales bacterium]|nr:DNA starvation/stationary phase protection protein Dps [Bryobacterales bacterium]